MKSVLLIIMLIFSTSLALADNIIIPIASNYDDYYVHTTQGTIYTSQTLTIMKNNFLSPSITSAAYIIFNTSTIPNDATITEASINLYLHSYTTSGRPAPTKTYYLILENSYAINPLTYTKAQWEKITIPSAGYEHLQTSDNTTTVTIGVSDPGSSKSRAMTIRARDYFPSGYGAYLNITYTLPSSGYCGTDYEGEEDWLINTHVICTYDEFNDITYQGIRIDILGNSSLTIT
jgi:hypothetical protein